jgi:hypothetical protein
VLISVHVKTGSRSRTRSRLSEVGTSLHSELTHELLEISRCGGSCLRAAAACRTKPGQDREDAVILMRRFFQSTITRGSRVQQQL